MTIIIFLETLALLSCVVFTGIAAYISLVEHPARMECGAEIAAKVFGPFFRRAVLLLAALALIAGLSGLLTGLFLIDARWFWGAGIISSVLPFTVYVLMPTNRKLLAAPKNLDRTDTAQLLKTWGRLHALRSLLGVAATAIYVNASLLVR